jgi:REP element-mobilizing transposase RayT
MATPPRRILRGTTYLVTRRCSERRFFLRPSRKSKKAILYALAVAAERYGVLVHAFCVLSNHLHLVLTDARGCLPEFMRDFSSLVARTVNVSVGHVEALFAGKGYSAVELVGPEDVVAKIAYTLANPVAAGLVEHGSLWPGLRTSPNQLGSATLTARRPKFFFDESGFMPSSAELRLTVPPCFPSANEFRARVEAELRELEAQRRAEVVASGRRFLGAAAVLAQDPHARPASNERRFGLIPRVAARDKWKRMEALSRLKTFLVEYRAAWVARRAGLANVVFPAGTWLLRVMHDVPCAAPP